MGAPDEEPLTSPVKLTVTSWLATDASNYLPGPREVLVLDSATGMALVPEVRLRTGGMTGKVLIPALPSQLVPSLHVIGTGEAPESHDSISLNFVATDSDGLLRASSSNLAQLVYGGSSVTPRPKRAMLWGSVGWRPRAGKPSRGIGCAQVFLDDAPSPDTVSDQRYVSANGLPTLLSIQDATPIGGLRSFFFGNIAVGAHTVRVSLDGGASFIAETHFVISRARQDALGPAAEIAYDLAIDVDAPRDPTPATCHYD
jgi:hypothetical protein